MYTNCFWLSFVNDTLAVCGDDAKPFRLALVVFDRLNTKGVVSGNDFNFNDDDEQGSLLYLKLFNDFLNSVDDAVWLEFIVLLLADSGEGVEFNAE